MRLELLLSALALPCFVPACRGAQGAAPHEVARGPEARAIEGVLDELYRSFCFDAGGTADWTLMHSLFAEGAAFVAPVAPGAAPGSVRAVDAESFLADFADSIEHSAVGETGMHERILHARIEVFGSIAHAWVTFEGFVPGEAVARSRGVDSVQLVRDGDSWKLASFTTQYETPTLSLPRRFLTAP